MNASDFHARPGEAVGPKVRALARFILKQSNITLSGTGMRRHQYARGTQIVAEMPVASFGGSFTVTLKGSTICTVGLGTVDGATVPTINETPIDGMVDGKQQAVPELDITGGPNDDLRSWVCLRATPVDGAADDEAAFSFDVIHTNDDSRLDGRDDDQKRGLFPLAMLVWTSQEAVSRVVRHTWFDQRHSYDAEARLHDFRNA